ncbi:extracellular solute-binding protein [Acidisoma silvae]|uniref:Substrate-binding domain-containing protein n=1 Tax=Acidisoma silvae TaxID=2802396 RepID=A0A964DYL8_9PROT|nr:extracellular solute-binding protein [Acidisoma silvae]MCB8875207.1 substrate-binding domain-containing protein [Acidisoma silvae]
MQRRDVLLGGLSLSLLPLAARAASGIGTVNVLYAGSMVNMMEHGIGPAFDKATGGSFRGYAGGSNKLANEIKGKLIPGDVFISASPKVNDSLIGAANGAWVDWYVGFAQSPLVIGYDPNSKFAADLKTKPWYEVMQMPGIRIGRTDPKLDPKGKLTVDLLAKAETVYKLPGLAEKVLGAPENPAQVLPEETLVGRLQSGQMDAAFFYSTETTDLKIPFVTLPKETALSAHYTATVLNGAPHADAGIAFLAFLLGDEGKAIMRAHGLGLTALKVTGDATKVPPAIQALAKSGQ